jgi:peptidoglycan hydrolase-like protein with peptidoglycan-binding domain
MGDAGEVSRQSGSGIPTERVTEIQNALIKLGYLDAPPSSQYDDATTDAMKEFQADNKIPATGLPSALALQKLGVRKRSEDSDAIPIKKN